MISPKVVLINEKTGRLFFVIYYYVSHKAKNILTTPLVDFILQVYSILSCLCQYFFGFFRLLTIFTKK